MDLVKSLAKSPIPGGRIELIIGPMFAGKTSELMRRIRKYTVSKKTAIIAKYSKDVRVPNSETSLVTHDGISYPAISCDSDTFSHSAADLCKFLAYDVIGIDEAQFFHGLVLIADFMANQGKIVILAGLTGTFERKTFGEMGHMLAIADQIDMLDSVCSLCHGHASFSKRITTGTNLEEIGGPEKYQARCRQCFHYE